LYNVNQHGDSAKYTLALDWITMTNESVNLDLDYSYSFLLVNN